MLTPHCGYVAALCHVEEQHLIYLEVAGALTTTPTCHGRYVTTLCVCCSLVPGVEIICYACVQKYFLSFSLQRSVFNLCMAIKYQLIYVITCIIFSHLVYSARDETIFSILVFQNNEPDSIVHINFPF
jgi:hypothetical protein